MMSHDTPMMMESARVTDVDRSVLPSRATTPASIGPGSGCSTRGTCRSSGVVVTPANLSLVPDLLTPRPRLSLSLVESGYGTSRPAGRSGDLPSFSSHRAISPSPQTVDVGQTQPDGGRGLQRRPQKITCGDDEAPWGGEYLKYSGDDAGSDDVDVNAFNVRLSESIMGHSLTPSKSGEEGGGGVEHKYSTLKRSVFHVFKGNVGAGVFLLPTYYQDTGYLLGLVLVALVGVLTVDCAVSLVRVKERINRVECKTYPVVVEYVLGAPFMHFIRYSLIFTQFGFCVIYLQYSSSLFAALLPYDHAYYLFVALGVVVVTPMTLFSNRMALLAYASLVAGLFVFVVLVGAAAVDLENLVTSGVGAGVNAVIPSMRFIVFLSGHMFSLEGIGVVLPVENSLAPEDRHKFSSIMKYTLSSIVAMYIVFGVLGYLAYGDNLHTSVVLALPDGIARQAFQVLLGLSLIFGFPIIYVPAIQLVDKALGMHSEDWQAWVVRATLNCALGLMAAFIGAETINVFASFLGAFAGVHLMVSIPALLGLQIDNAVEGHQFTLTQWEYTKLIFTRRLTLARARWFAYLLFALFVWVGGSYYTVLSVMTARA